MGKIRRKFDLEFKQRIVAAIRAGQTTYTLAAREHQISPSVIKKWLDKDLAGEPIQTHPSKREREQEDRIAKLERKVAQLVMENDQLKKLDQFVRQTRMKNDTSSVITASNLNRYRKGVK